MNDTNRITLEPGKRGGRPCIRGLRITVYDILAMLAEGMAESEILEDFPELEVADIRASLAYAASREHSVRQVLGVMKLLLDENLSRRLVPFLQAKFPDSTQVALAGVGARHRSGDMGPRKGSRLHNRYQGCRL
jgi:uncharacterized protein (DUF433 family)